MPEQPTIIIQNSNQQNNDGCSTGCGSGCAVIVLIAILLYPISMVGEAMDGKAAGWWIPLGIFLTLVEVVLIGGVAFAWLDQKFGWGYADGSRAGQTPNSNTIPAEDLAGDVGNYGAYRQRESPPPPAGEARREKMARSVPHPDDTPKPRPIAGLGEAGGVNQRIDLADVSARRSGDDPYDRIRKLAKLRDDGLITADEFEQKKADMLREL